MKTLTDWFNKVYVINCPHRPDRLKAVMEHLDETGMADISKVIVHRAIVGDWTTCPADWNAGRGAWGCLASHRRLLEDVLHDRDDRHTLITSNYLVLEDDVFFVDGALEKLNEFMEAVPNDWQQIYLGGQHSQPATKLPIPGVMLGNSINRTHAYALRETAYHRFYQHITYASDYRGTNKHIDHQLELAHRRKDWLVYCPEKWIAGQEAGSSNISGRTNPRQLWQ